MNLNLLMSVLYTLFKAIVIVIPLVLCVSYFTYFERKIIAYMHVRVGPNRVGYLGLLQPFADAFKLMFKELIIPAKSNKFLFIMAPVITFAPSLTAWAVIPFNADFLYS